MRLDINIDKSIELGKLVSNSYFHKFIDFFNVFFFTIVFIIMIIAPVKGERTEITILKIVLIVCVLLIAILGKVIARRMSKLVSINDWKKNTDVIHIYRFAEDNGWPIVKEDENLIVFRADNGLSNERQVSFLLRDGFLYVNVISFGMYDIKSPIYYTEDRKVLNQIMKELTLHNTG